MTICHMYASSIISTYEVSKEYIQKQNITPWELEVFAAFSVMYDDLNPTAQIIGDVFASTITLISL